ncbi:cupin domain-containing protein [Gynuella sp.]|uniref:cupin domain-containing protein n=1 Tax=Gynuella sp. TaxID=2969146 RepID=UPI003D0C776F
MPAQPSIHHQPASEEYYFHEGCYILELLNSDTQPELSIARATVRPGVTTRWHQLEGITERYVIQQGCGRVEVGELQQSVSAGSVVVIPPGCRQRITNTGDEDLVFLALCLPRFVPDAYVDLESSTG